MTQINAKLLLALNILVLPVFLVTIAFNVLANNIPGNGVFLSTTAGVSNTFATEITPAGWTFIIWGFIYSWQLIWIIYSLTLPCRSGPEGPLYLNPVLLSSLFFGIYIFSLLLNIFWLFMFDRGLLELAFVILVGITTTLFVCLALSYKALYTNRFVLAKQNRRCEDTLIRVFVHNGLGIYAAWTTIAAFLNMAIVIAFRSNPPINQSTASTISLAFIAVAGLIYVVTDLTVWDKFSRYTITPYVVSIWSLVGILVNNFNANSANSVITAVLLALSIAVFIVKLVLVIVRSVRQPLFPSDTSGKEETTMSDYIGADDNPVE